MYKREFDTLLASGKIPRALFLYGENPFLIGYYGARVVERLSLLPEEKNSFYFGEYEFQALKGILSQSSLFGDRSFVLLRLEKKLLKKEIDALLGALEKNPSAYWLIEFYKAENKSATEYSQDCKAMAGSFKGNERAEVRFFDPNQGESLAILRERALSLGMEVEDRWLLSLWMVQNQELGLAYNELEKFALLGRKPEMRDIERLSYGLGSVSVEELCVALLEKKEALKIALALEEEGIEEMALCGEMERFFYQLFLFYAHIRVHGNSDSSEILGYKLPKMIEEKKARAAIGLKEAHFFRIFTALQEWREKIMQGRSRGRGLFLALIKIQAIL